MEEYIVIISRRVFVCFCLPFFPLLRNDTYAGASGWWQGHILASNMWKSHAASKIFHVQQPSIAAVRLYFYTHVRWSSIYSCVYSLTLSLTHPFTCPFIRPFIRSFIHPFLRSFGCLSIQSVHRSIHPTKGFIITSWYKMTSECFRFR